MTFTLLDGCVMYVLRCLDYFSLFKKYMFPVKLNNLICFSGYFYVYLAGSFDIFK